jgi:hypothetical protein
MATSIVIDASQLVDLALGTPEIGAVNFNLLHSLLHIIINQLNLKSTRIEIGGTQCSKIELLAKNLPPQPEIQLVEYSIKDSNLNPSYNNRVFKGKHSLSAPKSVLVIKKQTDVDGTPAIVDLSRTFEAEAANTPSLHSIVSTDDFQELTKKFTHMQDALPDQQQILELSNRMKEAESGIEKITSLVNDLAREYSKIEQNVLPFLDCVEISILKNKIDEIQRIIFEETGKVVKEISVAPDNSPHLTPTASIVIDVPTINPKRPSLQKPITATSNFINEEIRKLKNEIENIKKQIKSHPGRRSIEMTATTSNENDDVPGLQTDNDRIQEVTEKVNRLEVIAANTEKQIVMLTDKQRVLEAAPNSSGEAEQIYIASNVDSLKAELGNTAEIVSYLMGQKTSIVEHIDTIVNDIQQLKEHKLDKEDIDEMMAEKADFDLLERKVSIDMLETTKYEFVKKFDAIFERFQTTDLSLQHTMSELQELLATKLDKEEIPPLKDYFNDKFKAVQSRLKALALLKPDTEAAGTKTKFLRDVNCISCDNDVVMQLHQESIPKATVMPPGKSPKPFLMYKLDSIRKQVPQEKNLRHFETALELHLQRSQVMNRYCGGSHTKISTKDKLCSNKKTVKIECLTIGQNKEIA